MNLIASKAQLKIISKFDWNVAYEMKNPGVAGSSCLCLDNSCLNEGEIEELKNMELAGLCWQEPLNLGGIWHLTPLGAVQAALAYE